MAARSQQTQRTSAHPHTRQTKKAASARIIVDAADASPKIRSKMVAGASASRFLRLASDADAQQAAKKQAREADGGADPAGATDAQQTPSDATGGRQIRQPREKWSPNDDEKRAETPGARSPRPRPRASAACSRQPGSRQHGRWQRSNPRPRTPRYIMCSSRLSTNLIYRMSGR